MYIIPSCGVDSIKQKVQFLHCGKSQKDTMGCRKSYKRVREKNGAFFHDNFKKSQGCIAHSVLCSFGKSCEPRISSWGTPKTRKRENLTFV